MIFGAEEQKKHIEERITALRTAASFINRVKAVCNSFDGKVYNKRFDDAIGELSGDDGRLYVSNRYGWMYVIYYPRHGYKNEVTLLTGYSCVKTENNIRNQDKEDFILFDDHKRINAAAMIEGLNRKYAEILKEAYELEETFKNIDQILDQVKKAKEILSAIVAPLPSIIIDTYGIKRYY
jgi:hypothetical protein